MALTTSFWRERRVFVTGHTGFKGSWLLLMLRSLGARVHGFALPAPTSPSLFDLLALDQDIGHQIGDIRDLDRLQAAVDAANPDIIIHMAAQPLVRASYDDPVLTYAVNVMGTVNLLEAARRRGLPAAIVVVTTDKCYENRGWPWGYREIDRLGGADPYSNSKAACEMAVSAYQQSFFPAARHAEHQISLASARAGNVIGGGDFALDRLVPDAVRAFAAGAPLQVRNPLAVRPWQHVLEPLLGYLLLAECLHADPSLGSGWNFGPQADASASVGSVADRLAALWSGGAAWQQDAGGHPHEAQTLQLDSSRAKLQLRWPQRYTLDEALGLTVEWYRLWHDGGDVAGLARRQTEAFLAADRPRPSRAIMADA